MLRGQNRQYLCIYFLINQLINIRNICYFYLLKSNVKMSTSGWNYFSISFKCFCKNYTSLRLWSKSKKERIECHRIKLNKKKVIIKVTQKVQKREMTHKYFFWQRKTRSLLKKYLYLSQFSSESGYMWMWNSIFVNLTKPQAVM